MAAEENHRKATLSGSCRLLHLAAVVIFKVAALSASLRLQHASASGANPGSYGVNVKSGSKFTGIIIPGFASSRLRAWALLKCPFTPFGFSPLDPVWLDTQKVLGATSCWLKCMMLEPRNQTDHPECKSRVDLGLIAITELDPGYITGPLSSVWREWVNWCAEFGVDVDALHAVPYDWRLYPAMLEDRDLYFHKLKITFEAARKLRGPALVFAHSMGNNVFRYFLEWLKHEMKPREYQPWIDQHIHAYYAIGAPLLGSPEAVKGLLTGLTFGLPISQGVAKTMGNSFAASMWMYPIPSLCHHSHPVCPHPSPSSRRPSPHLSPPLCRPPSASSCEGRNASGWPLPIVSLAAMPSAAAATAAADAAAAAGSWSAEAGTSESGLSAAYPSSMPDAAANFVTSADPSLSSPSALLHCPQNDSLFFASHFADGSFLRDIAAVDVDAEVFADKIHQWYLEDPILNPLTPWERPPIGNVFCAYGIDLKTEVGYSYSESGEEYPNNWRLDDVFFETEGGALRSESGLPVYGNKFPASGDVTVPYVSLSFCKTWLGSEVNITRAPMQAHEPGEVQKELNVPHDSTSDIFPHNFTRCSDVPCITYYEDSSSRPGQKTAVWELDKVDHRNIVQSHVLLREIWLEALHDSHEMKRSPFVLKDFREPMRDEDCYWDYSQAKCAFLDHCEYRYVFGDIHLGQSCRLKKQEGINLFHKYL